jgi:hypothetical protein
MLRSFVAFSSHFCPCLEPRLDRHFHAGRTWRWPLCWLRLVRSLRRYACTPATYLFKELEYVPGLMLGHVLLLWVNRKVAYIRFPLRQIRRLRVHRLENGSSYSSMLSSSLQSPEELPTITLIHLLFIARFPINIQVFEVEVN